MSTSPNPPPTGPRMVKCVKLGRELPGLAYLPYNNDLGRRIHESVSQQAWNMWVETAKMILNEYRLNLATPEAQRFLFQQCERFFFGPGAQVPPEYVPPQPPGH